MSHSARNPLSLSIALIAALLAAPLLPARAIAITTATCDDSMMMPLPAGDAMTDLEVTGPCEVKAGSYTFRNVNIFTKAGAMSGGNLHFDDATINFFAENILIESGGSMIAGSAATPIGSTGAVITIHLWGPSSDPGALCKTDDRCGTPDTIWGSNPTPNPDACNTTPLLPGGVTSECFYSYGILDDADAAAKLNAYFGHKVLALSYGGTLQLFGSKGATYAGRELSTCKETDASCTGTSWLRLSGSLGVSATTLMVAGNVDWKVGDHIVVTTTDYLPSHSEELEIVAPPPSFNGTTTTINFKNANPALTGVQWPHNGQMFDYTSIVPARLGLASTKAETRAAVALLSRSIRIVSDGVTPGSPFTEMPGNFYGGHTIIRQGFASSQLQGVEFFQLGQGGSIMHYPVHFHLARRTPQPAMTMPPTPPITFVKDCSIRDSMTRWITVHGTQGALLARNVGFLSIGHGFYLEDGTETDNQLHANIGILARAAVDNAENPRQVPGILTRSDINKGAAGFDDFPFFSDSNHPTAFWITNGQNDIEYNMAAGAATCGACYWFVPGAISGMSRNQHWFGYAGEQLGEGRAGITPLREFLGNACSSAMNAFQVNSDTAACNGVNFIAAPKQPNTTLVMLPSAGADKNFPVPEGGGTYWPIVTGGHKPTRCPAADQNPGNPNTDCSNVNICSNGDESNCDVTTLDQFTTSFNWAQQNFAAVWLRPLWALVLNSVVSDVQNGGINFVTSGDFSKAAVINGFWAVARKTVFIGSTQTDNPLASNAGPFNPFVSSDKKTKGLACASDPNNPVYNALYCLSKDDGMSIQLSNFSDFQRYFSVYDGPAFQDSNAYLNIHPTYLTTDGTAKGGLIGGCRPDPLAGNPCVNSGFMNAGLAGLKADQMNGRCYFPNAGIGWKQPNGFYYSPAFHSINLFFNGVDIRHFVTEPLFKPGTFDTDVAALKKEYCFWASTAQPGTFTGFTDIDRETVLNDDDGTLTGLTSTVNNPPPPLPPVKSETLSVNKEQFFNAPVCTTECASDAPINPTGDAKLPPNTADTSPYEYVTASIYPECALSVPDSKAPLRVCADQSWGSGCTTSDPTQVNSCVGIPLFRQFLNVGEKSGIEQQKRMMGQDTFQRSGLVVNHGNYYIDTTVSAKTQSNQGAKSINVFVGSGKYDLFFLYANKNTAQQYKMFVSTGQPDDFGATNVKFGFVDITTAKYTFKQERDGALPAGWSSVYDKKKGILTLTTNMTSLKDAFDLNAVIPGSDPPKTLGEDICQPAAMCAWSKGKCRCNITDESNYLFDACHEKNAAGDDAICFWSVKSLDCPAQGCPGLQITMPMGYAPDDAADHHRPTPAAFTTDPDFAKNWNVPFNLEDASIAGTQCAYTGTPGSCLIPMPTATPTPVP